MSANILGDDVDPKKDFEWLDDIPWDDCFMDMMPDDSGAPSKSLDFGQDGYTGSLTAYHELLQMTAPDLNRGLVYIRGDFPNDASSMLARAQRRNAQGTWGLKPEIDSEDKLQLQGPDETGFINLRWPCAQFSLECEGYMDGTYTTCSFVKDGTLYQVIRIVPGERFKQPQDSAPAEPPELEKQRLKLSLGGRMIMKRPRITDDFRLSDESGEYTKYYSEETKTLSFRHSRHINSLAMRLWIDRQRVELTPGNLPRKSGTVDMTATHEIELIEDTPKVIIAAISLFNSPSDEVHGEIVKNGLPDLIKSSIAQDYMGVSDSSKNAAYRLWNHILPRDVNNRSKDFEMNTVGRSIEQILCVSSLPMIASIAKDEPKLTSNGPGADDSMGAPASPTLDERPQGPTSEPKTKSEKPSAPEISTEGPTPANNMTTHAGVALIKNIVSSQWVDLESTFWQMRLLIKAFKFFRANASQLPEKDDQYLQPIREMGTLYTGMLLNYINLGCKWLLNYTSVKFQEVLASISLPHPDDHKEYLDFCHIPGTPGGIYFSTDGYFYHTIILWYVLQNCPEALEGSEIETLLRTRMEVLDKTQLPESQDDPKTSLLRWYHCSYFLRKYKESDGDIGDRASPNHPVNRERTWKAKATRSLKPSGKDRWHGALEDPLIANLALLGEELFSGPLDNDGQPNKVLSYAKEFIRNRDYTTTLNPGRKDPKQANHTTQYISPPWELISLNHHSPLRPQVDISEDRFDTALEECREFILADYTFAGTWDGSDRRAFSQWWDLLPTSIFATTLLDWRLQNHDGEASVSLQNGKQEQKLGNGAELNGKRATLNKIAPSPGTISRKPTAKRKDDDIVDLSDLIKRLKDGLVQASKEKIEEEEEFNWMDRKPQRVTFTDTFVQSLEDTPDLFRSKQLKNVKIRSNIEKYMARKNNNLSLPEPDWTLDTAAQKIKAEELIYVGCYEIWKPSYINGPGRNGFLRTIHWHRYPHRFGPELSSLLSNELDHLPNEVRPNRDVEQDKHRDFRKLWFFFLNGGFLNGVADRHPKFSKLSQASRRKLQDTNSRKEALSWHQSSLFSRLNDSFVDLGTQFRILFVQRYTPIVIQAFIYMWHTDALDAFDDHLGTVSRFFNGHTSSGSTDVWITSITLLHYNLEYNDEYIPKVFDEVRGEKAWFPPVGVAGVRKSVFRKMLWFWPAKESESSNLDIGETASTLVITGDEKGFSWTCSIISSTLEESAMALCTQDSTDILEMFNHQRYSGRSLVFIMFLGHICESLARKNEHFLHTLDTVMDMDQKALLKGIEWQKSQLALRRLKTMLWSMEALRIFDDKLVSALTEIKEARSNLIQELDKEDYLRPKALKRYKENVLEDFDKRYTRLKDSHTSILQLIDQSSRLREGITSVLGVEQNENIAMLTYITIAYLPLGFIAAMFSTHIVSESIGLTTFGWLIATFFIGTFIFALSLQTILGATRRFWKAVDQQTSSWEKSFISSARQSDRPSTAQSRSASSNLNMQPGVPRKNDLESGTRVPT